MQYSIKLSENFSKKTIRQLLEEDWLVPRKVRHFLRIRNNVLVNHKRRMFQSEIRANDLITLIFEASDYPETKILLGEKKEIEVLYEDEHLIIVNKPQGIKTHPNQPSEKNTLLNYLATLLAEENKIPYVVHRLDKETGGAILFAKNQFVLPILGRMFERREIHRKYQAVVCGNVVPKQFTIDQKIGRSFHDCRKRIIDHKNGVKAITHVNVVDKNPEKSQLEITLETGRTHQIRVHLANIKHPIMGDKIYNPKKMRQNLQLNASELWLKHPFSKEKVHVFAKNEKLDLLRN